MLVVHISCTPLAGAPIRIVNALNKYTDYNARLIDLNPNQYGKRTYLEDLIWGNNREECLQLISEASIIHFHHFFNIESANNPFRVNFKEIAPKTSKFVRQFHSNANFIAKNSAATLDVIRKDRYPKLVIPHPADRSFMSAYLVPNIIPINDDLLLPKDTNNNIPKVFFSATSSASMWSTRWETKGLPEIKDKFKTLAENNTFEFNIIENKPYEECIKLKQNSDIVIGDIASGCYHLTDLESLSQGKPTFTYLDSRTQLTLQNLLQCDELPFINTRLEEVDLPFIKILNDRTLRNDLGKYSRKWIEKYYDEKVLIKHYTEAYEKILNDEKLIRKNFVDEYINVKKFLNVDLYDMQWKQRKNLYYNNVLK